MYYSIESIDRRIAELEKRAYYNANFGSSNYESQCDCELSELYAEREELVRQQKQQNEK